MKKTEKLEQVARTRKAEVIKIVLSDVRKDDFTGRFYEHGNYVLTLDERGEQHIHHNHAFDKIPEADRVIGRKGVLTWYSGPGMACWFWKAEPFMHKCTSCTKPCDDSIQDVVFRDRFFCSDACHREHNSHYD